MLSVWTKHLKTEKERQEFGDYLRKSRLIFERIAAIVKEEEDKLDSSELSPKAYDSANWDYLQAHKNGYRQCLRLIKKLINLDQREDK